MSYEPVTYCDMCNEPFDVHRAPDDRLCDECAEIIEALAEKE
ncbi:hypothetical protein LCGC14_0610330 [marine sediment metagenome]|uniref:Uncharacterized protein n=1 Tax=marine sediment metagenome TaxID=412755 RepID=A0A0F9RCJ1_9ZZZZ